jgi:protein-S-isoprenylcysteine O-methyltransferase Ste14
MNIYPLPLMLGLMVAQYILGGFPSLTHAIAHPIGLVALAVGGFGLLLMLISFIGLKRRNTTVDPTRSPNALVTTGLYRISRNPMYLGMLLMLFLIPLMAMRPRPLVFTLVFFLIMNFYVIPREERRIEKIFGSAFTQYKKRVRRWL